jgi:L-ascorbate metabolism protein UlaG (beta-lactamase superfamily)
MKLTLVRNATLLLEYAGQRLLVDPLLADQGAYPGFAGTFNSHLDYPLTPLPLPLATLVDVDAVLVTHLHPDHWDAAARRHLGRALPVFAQDALDAAAIRADGFTDVRRFDGATFGGIGIAQTAGQHGSDAVMAAIGSRMGRVSGIVLRHPDEPTLYIAGDTVWNDHVAAALEQYAPDIVVLNCGDAQVPGLGKIIMDQHDVLAVAQAAPHATLVATHLEAVNHCVLSRAALRGFLAAHGIGSRVKVPEDGQSLVLPLLFKTHKVTTA